MRPLFLATPYPGSELYEICRENKYIPDNFSLDDLFIRSFSISTEDWTGEELKEILRQGQRFLLISHWKKHPSKFFKDVFTVFMANPTGFVKRSFNFALGR